MLPHHGKYIKCLQTLNIEICMAEVNGWPGFLLNIGLCFNIKNRGCNRCFTLSLQILMIQIVQ